MRIASSFFAVFAIVALANANAAETSRAKAPEAPAKAQVIYLEVTSEGFVPDKAKVRVGRPVKLVVTRKVERTCATDIVIADYKISKPLPLGVPVEVTLSPRKPGAIRFACAMDMIAGVLIAE